MHPCESSGCPGIFPRSIQDPIKTNEINISGSLNVLSEAQKNPLKGSFSPPVRPFMETIQICRRLRVRWAGYYLHML